MSELDNAIKRLKENADNRELSYMIADLIKKNCSQDVINLILYNLKDYDNINPSDALEILYNNAKLDRDRIERGGVVTYAEEIKHNEGIKPYYDIVKQALLKGQENATSDEILQKYYQEGITLDSVKALKQERDDYNRALKIIDEKFVDIRALKYTSTYKEYNRRFLDLNPTVTTSLYFLIEEEFNFLKRWY